MSQPSKLGSTIQGAIEPSPTSSKPDNTKASGFGGYSETQPGSRPSVRKGNVYDPRGTPSAPTHMPSKPARSLFPASGNTPKQQQELDEISDLLNNHSREKTIATNKFGSERYKAYQPPATEDKE